MSKVSYNNQRLIPAPFVNITKNYSKTNNGDIIGKVYNITINGTIMAYMGSPTSSGTFWTQAGYPDNEVVGANSRLSAIQRKQEAIRELFSIEGQQFEIQALDGSLPVKCNPRIVDINFPNDLWFDKCAYTITLECDELYGGAKAQEDTFDEYISNATEEWTIDTNEDQVEFLNGNKTYALSHTVSAVGKKFYDETGNQPFLPWQYARNYVLDRLGFDSTIMLSSGVNNLPSYYNGWNHVRNESLDEAGGGFSVTERWLVASGSAIEDFTIQTTTSLDTPFTRVSLNGNIRGFEYIDDSMNIVSTKYDNALTKYTQVSNLAYIRAQQYSGLSLNITPLSNNLGKNPLQGTIDYSFEYDNRPMNLISGSRIESISIEDNVGGEMFASVFVLGRTRGPVLQGLGSKQANVRRLSLELFIDPPTFTSNSISTMRDIMINQKPSNNPIYSGSIANLIYAVDPANNGFSTSYNSQPVESWEPRTGHYTLNREFTYE